MKNQFNKILDSGEKIIATDIRYLLTHGSWTAASNILVSSMGVLVTIAFANLISPEVYGKYKYILAIFGLLSVTSLQSLNRVLNFSISKGNEGDFFAAFKTKLRWGMIGSLGSLGVAAYYFFQGNLEFSIVGVMFAVFLPIHNALTVYRSLLNGRKLFKRNAQFNFLSQLIAGLALVSTIYLTEEILTLIAVYLSVYTALNLLFFWWSIRMSPPNNKTEDGLLTYGKQLTAINTFTEVSTPVATFLLWHLLGAAEVAIYLFALFPLIQLRALLKFSTPLAIPKLVDKTPEQLKRILPRKILRFSLIISLFVAGYILIAPYLFNTFFPKYTESVFYSQLAILSLLLYPKKFFGMSLTIRKKKKHVLMVQVIPEILKIVFFLILIPVFGILGAIIAVLLADFSHFLIVYFLFRRL